MRGWGMKRRFGYSAVSAGVVVAGLCLVLTPAFGQLGSAPERKIHKLPPGGPTPRTADGHPDLSGVWFPNSAGEALNAARPVGEDPVDPDARRQFDPKVTPEEKPSYQPWAAEKMKEANTVEGQLARTSVNCLPRGVPGMFAAAYPVEIFSTPGYFVVLVELNNNFRVVHTDGRPHDKNPDPLFNGDSSAHWEKDTLVIDTISLDERTFINLNGWFHSDQLHLVERFSRPSKNYLVYQFTVDDPKVLTKPWTSAPHYWSLGHEDIQEYYCTNNAEVIELEKIKEQMHEK